MANNILENSKTGKNNIHLLKGDFNGNGRDDILIWDSSTGEWKVNNNCKDGADAADAGYSCWLNGWAIGESWTSLIGDFNGDGMDDIAVYYADTGDWQVALSTGEAFTPDKGRGDWSWLKNWAAGKSWVPLVGDFNGDGKDDIAVWNSSAGDWQVALSSGREFIPDRGRGSGSWLRPWAIGSSWVPMAGDFNGDGRDDIAVLEPSTGDWQVALSGGNEFIPDIGRGDCSWLVSWAVGEGWIYYIGDFNGDGRDDIAVFSPSTGELQASFSNGGRFIPSYINRISNNKYGDTGKGVLAGDFDGDGCDEILLFAGIPYADDKEPVVVKIDSERTVNPYPIQYGDEYDGVDINYAPAENRYTIIQSPSLSWGEPIFQRSHQLMSEFARQGNFAIFTNITDDRKGSFWFANENLCISNDLKATLQDVKVKEKMTGTKVVLWVTWPESVWIKEIVNADIIVFDYIDECADEFQSWNDKLNYCMECADIITTTSKNLFDHAKSLYPSKVFHIPNGADIRKYFRKNTVLPDDLRLLKGRYKCIAGFIGTIYTWIDFEWVRGMARERPEWGFVFIGPDYKSYMKHEKLDNIIYLGTRKYSEIADYVKCFDIGLIPFEVRKMTHSANPIKMYEYMAAGIPVIATPIDECTALSPYVRTAGTAKEAVLKAEEALELSQYEKSEYRSIAILNSWTKRVEDIIGILDRYTKKKANNKKLSIVSSGFFTPDGGNIAAGGLERYTRDMAYLCNDLGYDVTVHQFGDRHWQKEYKGISVKAYPWKGGGVNWCRNAKECIDNTMKSDIDAADYVLYMWIGYQNTYRPNSISISHGLWLLIPEDSKCPAEPYAEGFVAPAIRQLAALVAVDLNFMNICRCVLPYEDINKIQYIPNYTDIELFKPAKRPDDGMIEVLYPRRYDAQVGIYLIQDIVPDMLEKYPNLRFSFAMGDMDEYCKKHWNEWYSKQPHRDRIKYGSYSLDDMPSVYRDADIVVLPSLYSEGTSFTALEAMAMGKAVVASNVGGLSDIIIPGVNGKLVNPSQKEIKRAIEEYISSAEERRLHGEKAAEIVKMAFSKKRWEKQWTDLILSIFKY